MTKGKKGQKRSFTFEASMARLERIVADLESGALSLEDSLEVFEEGVGLVKQCRDYLESSKQRVEVLLGEDSRGRPIIDTYEEDVDDEDE